MKLRHAFLLAALLLPFTHTAHAALLPEKPWRLALLPLDMPMEEALNGEFLEGIYEEHLRPFIRSSLRPSGDPVVRIETHLKPQTGGKDDPERDVSLDLWFSSQETGRRAFWLRTMRPFAATPESSYLSHLKQQFGKAAKTVRGVDGKSAWVVMVFIAPDTAVQARDAILAGFSADWPSDYQGVADLFDRDFRGKAHLLGKDFRGAFVSYRVDDKGKVSNETAELLDVPLAASVFNLAR